MAGTDNKRPIVSSSDDMRPTADQSPDRIARSLDIEVREQVHAGNVREAADLLLARLCPELRPFLHRLLGNVALAEEAHSATCERLWRGLASFRWECSLRSWSYIVARREASRCRARHARGAVQLTTLSAAEGVPVEANSSPTLSTTRRDLLENLRTAISDEDRDLIVMRVERGLPWKEIAVAFLEEGPLDEEAITRESARLRQRFRAIRVGVASALSKSKAQDPTSKS